MCLIAFAWHAVPHLPLVLAGNRDEFFERATASAQWWPEAPQVLAGVDLAGGGTWMGVTRQGRFAALTNYRAPNEKRPEAPTRGALVAEFLTGAQTPCDYLNAVAERGAAYNGFSLLAGDIASGELWIYSNRSGVQPVALPPGIFGLSNALLDTPWPKLLTTRDALRNALEGGGAQVHELTEHLLDVLGDATEVEGSALPATGMTLDIEKSLSAAFIRPAPRVLGGVYGTRSSTVLCVEASGHAHFTERCFDMQSNSQEISFDFMMRP